MKPAKEQAKELVDKFRNEFIWVEKDHNVDLYRDTKQCALIATHRTIDILNDILYYDNESSDLTDYIVDLLNNQKEVKQEIEKL